MAEKLLSRGEIFVVDDDPAIRETLSTVFVGGGYESSASRRGRRFWRSREAGPPPASCLDVHIPGKSGLDILKELHGETIPRRSS